MPGCQYTYQVLTMHIPQPIRLVVLISKRRTRFISVPQVHRTCLSSPKVCSYSYWWRTCCKSNKHIVVTGADKAMLSQLGGLVNAAAHGTIVTVTACYKALQQLDIPAEMLAAFLDLKDNPGSQMDEGLPDHVMAPCAQPSTNPSKLQMAVPFPTTLPDIQLPADFARRHGLQAQQKTHLAALAPLSQHLKEMNSWLTAPYMLTRKGAAYSRVTWDNVLKHILLFLGHIHEYQQITKPTLQHFLFPKLMGHYISCHAKARHSPNYINSILSSFALVLKWWQTKPGGRHPSFNEGLEWLNNLRSQVKIWLACIPCISVTVHA